MKKTTLIATLSLALLGFSQTANAANIGVVDPEAIYLEHPITKLFNDELNLKKRQIEKEMKNSLEELSEKIANLNKNKAKYAAKTFNAEVEKLKNERAKLVAKLEKSQKELSEQYAERRKASISLLQKDMSEFGKANGYDMIIEIDSLNPIFLSSEMDVTKKVIEFVKQKQQN